MRRRIDPAFQELLTAVLLWWLPAHRDSGFSKAQATARLTAACTVAREDNRPGGYDWPDECYELLLAAEGSLGLSCLADRIDKDVIQRATDAKWSGRQAWQNRADVGDPDPWFAAGGPFA